MYPHFFTAITGEGYLHFHQALSHLQNCREQW